MDCLDVHSAMAWRRGGLFGSAISCRDPEWSSNVCGGHQHGRSHTGVIQESYSSGACDGTWANAKDIARLAIHARRWNDSAVPCATANLTMTCWFSPQATSAMVRVEVTGMRRAMRMGMYPFAWLINRIPWP